MLSLKLTLFHAICVLPFTILSASVVDNDFETNLGVWQSTSDTDTATWLVQNFDEHWSIPRPAEGTSYAAIYRPDCDNSPDWNELRSPNLILQPGDAISFKYYLWGEPESNSELQVNVSNANLVTLHPLKDNAWHGIIVPLEIEHETNQSIIFSSFTGDVTAKVAIDEVRLVNLGTDPKSNVLNRKSVRLTKPDSKKQAKATASAVDNDFELDLGVWKNVPLGYSAGWLAETYNSVLNVPRPSQGTGYARALRYDCFEDLVRLRLESPEMTITSDDILFFDAFINCLETTSILRVLVVSDSVEFVIVELSTTNQKQWDTLIFPVPAVIKNTGKFVFELESTSALDYVAIDNIQLKTLGGVAKLP